MAKPYPTAGWSQGRNLARMAHRTLVCPSCPVRWAVSLVGQGSTGETLVHADAPP
jgi:hypothetical protein